MTSPSAIARRAVWTMRWFSSFFASCRPGVSISKICASSSLRIPRIRRRVVCGRGVTMATLCPTSRFTSVDLPTLVRPATATNPARCSPMALTALFLDSAQCEARGGLLALLLAAAFGDTEIAPGDSDSRGETLGVIGTAGRDQFVHRLGAEMPVCDFLQFGFVIALRRRSADIVGEQPLDHLLRGRQPAVGINRADHRLEHGGQNRGLLAAAAFFFAFSEPHHFVQFN